MRDYGKVWVDTDGTVRAVPSASARPRYKYPSHAALRANVYKRDGYACVECGTTTTADTTGYDGRATLYVERKSRAGYGSFLVIDHIVSLRNGGTNHPDNLQTLCDPCNSAKSVLVDARHGRT